MGWRASGAAFVLAFAGAACGPTDKERQMIAELTGEVRTVCIGRMLMDVPSSFRWQQYPEVDFYYGRDADFQQLTIRIAGEYHDVEAFTLAVNRRFDQIQGTIHDETGESVLVNDLSENETSRLIKRHENKYMVHSFVYELHLYLDGVHVFVSGELFPESKVDVLAQVRRIATQVRKPKGEMTQWGAGFCLGQILVDADNDYEVIHTYAADSTKGRRDVQLSFGSNDMPRGNNPESLSEQTGIIDAMLGNAVKVLRQGKTVVNGNPSEESLARLNEGREMAYLSFAAWVAPGHPEHGNPALSLKLETGGEQKGDDPDYDPLFFGIPSQPQQGLSVPPEVTSSLSDHEGVALWDAIVQSIRPRPGAAR